MEIVTMAFSLHGASWMHHLTGFLKLISPLLLVPIAFSLLYWGATTLLIIRRSRQPKATPRACEPLEPVAFLRPVKKGLPALEEKARLLLAAAQPGDWVLFGVATEEDRQLCLKAIAAQGRADLHAVALLCPLPDWDGPSYNPKVCKLEQLTAYLREHGGPERCLLSDSELLADGAALYRFRQEWHELETRAPQGAVLTAGYRFIAGSAGGTTLWQRLDQLPALLQLWPGLAITDRVADWRSKKDGAPGLGFTLGACIAYRQRDLDRVGGWEAYRGELAEDNRLGAALAALPGHGVPTFLSHEVFSLEGDPLTAIDWLRHQHRVAFTYRVCNTGGFTGLALTFGLLWAALWALAHPLSWGAWGLLFLTLGVRFTTAEMTARALQFPLGRDGLRGFPRRFVAIAIASLLEAFFWIVAWLPLPIWWGGRAHRVTSDGKFSRENAHFPESSLASGSGFHYQSDS